MFGVVLLVTFIMPVIYPLFITVVMVPICVSILVAKWQLMRIVELISAGDGEIMETLNSIGIKLFGLAALNEY